MSTRGRRGGRRGGRRPAREELERADSDLEQQMDDGLSDLEADDADGSGADVGDDQRAEASQNLPPTDRAPADASDHEADVAVGDEPHPTPANSGAEEDPDETTVHQRGPPPGAPGRRVRIRTPAQAAQRGANDRRRTRLTRRREDSQESDDYQTGLEDLFEGSGEDRPRRRPQRLQHTAALMRLREQLRNRHPAGDHAGPERQQEDAPRMFVSTCTEAPPPLQHDPTLYFTDEAKRDERYGMAAARALAQMALRDGGEERYGINPEPELIAWNLREVGAYDLISHRQAAPAPRPPPQPQPPQARTASNASTVDINLLQNEAPTAPIIQHCSSAAGGDSDAAGAFALSARSGMPLSMANVRMPVFKGQRWAGFKQQFERLAKHFKWTDEDKAVRLLTAIEDEGADALGVVDTSTWSYDELVLHLEKRYGKHKTCAQVLNEVSSIHRKAGQSLTEFHDQVVRIARTATLTPAQFQHVTYHGFTYGLRHNPQLQTYLFNHDVQRTIKTACQLAEDWETEHGESVFVQPPVTTTEEYVHAKEAVPRQNNNGGKKQQQQSDQPAKQQNYGGNAGRGGGGGGKGRGGKRGGKKRNRGGKNQGAGQSDEQYQHVQQLQSGAYERQQGGGWNQQYNQPPPPPPQPPQQQYVQQPNYAQQWQQPPNMQGATFYNPPAFQPPFPPAFQPRAQRPPQQRNQASSDARSADNTQPKAPANSGAQQD